MDLEKILKSGKSIEIQVEDDTGDIINMKTLIDKGYNAETESLSALMPRYNNVNYPFHSGDTIRVFFIAKEESIDILSFTAQVTKRTKEKDILLLNFKKIGDIEKIQRRSNFRFAFAHEFTLEYENETYEALLKDMSAGGMQFTVKKRIKANDILDLDIPFNDSFHLKTKAEVIGSNLQKDSSRIYVVRVKFTNIDHHIKDRITNFLLLKQGERLKKTAGTDAGDKLYKKLYGDYTEKRHGPDFLVQYINIANVFTWVLLFFTIIFFLKASPDISYGIGRFFRYRTIQQWDIQTLNLSMLFNGLNLALTSLALFFNNRRLKRHNDRYRLSLIFNLCTSIFLVIVYFYLV